MQSSVCRLSSVHLGAVISLQAEQCSLECSCELQSEEGLLVAGSQILQPQGALNCGVELQMQSGCWLWLSTYAAGVVGVGCMRLGWLMLRNGLTGCPLLSLIPVFRGVSVLWINTSQKLSSVLCTA